MATPVNPPLNESIYKTPTPMVDVQGDVAQLVERALGMREVTGSIPVISKNEGGVAQLVEHVLRMHGVVGSIPATSIFVDDGSHVGSRWGGIGKDPSSAERLDERRD